MRALPFSKSTLDYPPSEPSEQTMLQTVFKKLFSLREQAARRPGADNGFDPQEKPFLDHLDDLRVTLFKIITTLAISSAICFIFNKQIFQFVQIPAKSPIAEISPGITLYEKLDFFMLGPTELIFLMFKLAFYCGVIITFPFTVFKNPQYVGALATLCACFLLNLVSEPVFVSWVVNYFFLITLESSG